MKIDKLISIYNKKYKIMKIDKLISIYNKKYKGNEFTVYNRKYTFGEVYNEGEVKIYYNNSNRFIYFDIETVFNYIEYGIWDATTYIRKQKIRKLMNGTN